MNIIDRDVWGANPPKTAYSKNIAKKMNLAVHYTAMATAIDYEDELKQLKNIQKFHQIDRGWNDIGYSFLVGNTGNVYEGRGFGNRPASQGTNAGNKNYYSICWLGDAAGTPSKEALDSIKQLWKQIGGEIKPHKVFKKTSCPGLYLTTWIDSLSVLKEILEEKELSNKDTQDTLISSLVEERLTKLEKDLAGIRKIINKRIT